MFIIWAIVGPKEGTGKNGKTGGKDLGTGHLEEEAATDGHPAHNMATGKYRAVVSD